MLHDNDSEPEAVNIAQYLNMTSKGAKDIPFERRILGDSVDSSYNDTILTKADFKSMVNKK